MPTRTHPYNPNPSQALFHKAPQRYKGFCGSKGSGKTRTLIEEAFLLSYENPGNIGVIARRDYPALERTTMKYFLDWIPKEFIENFNGQKRQLKLRTRDKKKFSTIYFVQEKEPKEFDSMELGFFAIDEADECPYDTFKLLRSRLRLKDAPKYGLLAFNPTNRLHWLYNFFVTEVLLKKELQEQRALVRNNTYENMANLPPEYIDELSDTYSGDELGRYLLGDWGSTSNEWSVFQEYRSSMHLSKSKVKPIPGIPILRAWDFGMRAGCLCAQLYDGQIRVLGPEIIEFNKGADEFVPLALSRLTHLNNVADFVDLSDPTFVGNRSASSTKQTPRTILADHGVRITGGAKDWQKRTSSVNYFLTRSRNGEACLIIDPSCVNLVGGFEGEYKFREGAHDRSAADVKKNEYSELQDCLQHICVHANKELNRERHRELFMDVPEDSYAFSRLS